MAKKEIDIQQLMIKDYFGKSIREITDWYPKLITPDIVFQYLIQTNSINDLISILKYQKLYEKDQLDLDNDDAYFGFIALMQVLEELVFRSMALFFYSENWIAKNPKIVYLQKQHINYSEFLSFYNQTIKLHFITPTEYKEYVHERLEDDKQPEQHISLLSIFNNVKKYYYDYSLYLKIDQDTNYNDITKFKKILDPYNAQFGNIFLNDTLKDRLYHAKLYTPHYVYEDMFMTILDLDNNKVETV